jgi:hypothetical protein
MLRRCETNKSFDKSNNFNTFSQGGMRLSILLINDTRCKLRGIHDAKIIFFAASGGELTLSD